MMFKFSFLFMLLISTFIVISSNNWMGMWMGMEMNLMFFTPLMYEYNNKKTSQAMMIYFLVQSISSLLLLFSIMMNPLIKVGALMNNDITNLLINMSLLMKLGSAPFHNWMPEMMNNLNWNKIMLLMTWQKLAPLFVLSMMKMTMLFYMSIIMSTIIGGIGGMNTTSLRKIMAYSSINHMSWILLMMSNQSTWYMYWMLYSLMIVLTLKFFNSYNTYNINQLINKMPNTLEKYTYATLLLSMGGLPPFLGFIPKWMVIQSSIESNSTILFIMIMMSMITLFYYIRMISSIMLLYSHNNKWFKTYNNDIKYIYINLMLPMMLIFSFF